MLTWKLIMKILGYMRVVLLPLMILATTMDSSIASQIPPTASPTLEENTSCRRENQEEESEESQLNQTGNDILEALKNLNRILDNWEKRSSQEKSSLSTEPLERSTTRRQDSYSSMEF